jgi:hypothetical protein
MPSYSKLRLNLASRRNEHGNLHRYLALVDQVVEDRRQFPLLRLAHSVLHDQQTSRLLFVVLSRHVDAVLPRRPREDLALVKRERAVKLAFRNAVFRLRVFRNRVTFLLSESDAGKSGGKESEAQCEQQSAQHDDLLCLCVDSRM